MPGEAELQAARAPEQARRPPLLRGARVSRRGGQAPAPARAASSRRSRPTRTSGGRSSSRATRTARTRWTTSTRMFDDWVELHGDRGRADDGAIVAGIGEARRPDRRARRPPEGPRPEGAQPPQVRDGVPRGLREGDARDGARRPLRLPGRHASSTRPAPTPASPRSSTARAARSPARRRRCCGWACRRSPA